MQAVVVTFEHLALWSLGGYGNTWIRTPRFDRFAAQSVAFDQCYATAAPGDAFAGLTRLATELRGGGGAAIVHDCASGPSATAELQGTISDWQRLHAGGIPSLLWLRSPAIGSPWNAPAESLSTYRNEVIDVPGVVDALAEVLKMRGAPLPEGSDSADAWLAAAMPHLVAGGVLDRGTFASTSLLGRLRRMVYAAAVTALDAWFGEVVDLIDVASSGDTLLIATAGGGDFTGPHPEPEDGIPPLIEPLVHVPLLIRTGTDADGTRRNALASTNDIALTLADVFHVKHNGDENARSLWPLLKNETDELRDSLLIGSAQLGWRLQTIKFACLCGPAAIDRDAGDLLDAPRERPRLFVKPDDAWDTLDVAAQYPDVTAQMLNQIRAQCHGATGQ